MDPEQARTSPHKTTIAHGYLTLSLLPYLWGQVGEVENVNAGQYGIEKLRFNQAVTVGGRVRLRAHAPLADQPARGIAKAEIKGRRRSRLPKTTMDPTVVFLYHFK